jgi:hypothetical protein
LIDLAELAAARLAYGKKSLSSLAVPAASVRSGRVFFMEPLT